MRKPSPLVRPMDLSTPNSQLASFTFYVIDMSKRKKARKRDMQVMMAVNRLKIEVTASKLAIMSYLTRIAAD